MCAACEYQSRLEEIETHLVQSAYAPYAAELLTLADGIKARQHIGDAIDYRLQDIEARVKEASV